jgi:8-oxo-dGTP diphosphatase
MHKDEHLLSEKENINIWLSQIHNEYKLALSIDCVVFAYTDNDLYVLLIRCNMPPYVGLYSLVGDILEPRESLDGAAARILKERTGLDHVYLEQVKAYGQPDRHPLGRVVTVSYFSLIKLEDAKEIRNDLDGDYLKWEKVKDVKRLAFDHNMILDDCLKVLRKRLKTQAVGFNLLPEKFTLNDLQQLYEVVLAEKLDKRNFRKKLKASGYLTELKEYQTDVSHRPARLYSFVPLD